MKIDSFKIIEIIENFNYKLNRSYKPQSKSNWNVHEIHGFENDENIIQLSFTMDPTDGYLQTIQNRDRLKTALDKAIIEITNKMGLNTNNVIEIDLRQLSQEDINYLQSQL
ncbi:hypothetical protein [Flavobacterium sp. '19STA2R22 D10 B1']|uniref:hypothetical protein n=1 Tax=Flavobacterium aerium TaxID=3037261 RepID=UPI00278BF79F|nr:hypothetical protein [Flavobacterium sp. '19STA2R22 D10 B1']